MVDTPRTLKLHNFKDHRGELVDAYTRDLLPGVTFIKDILLDSRVGTLRGLHYRIDGAQGKLVMAITGFIFDVAVNLMEGDPNYGKWYGAYLYGHNREAFWVPPGYAHGFLSLTDSIVLYKSTTDYDPEMEKTLAWNDPLVGVKWPVLLEHGMLLSTKDRMGGFLNESIIRKPAP